MTDIIAGTIIVIVALSISTTLVLNCRSRIDKISRMPKTTVRDILRELNGPR